MRTAIILSILGALIMGCWLTLRLTHTLDFYRIPTSSSEPTYKAGSLIFASRFKKPDRGDFVCFRKTGNEIWVFRCIAKGNDVIELKDAIVYLNGKKLDEPYTYNEYSISKDQLNRIQGYVDQYKYPLLPINDSLSSIYLTTKELKEYHLNLVPVIQPKGVPGPEMFTGFIKYNSDNFGPIKVPKNYYFLLGDNRHNAYDSRYLGFVNSDEIISTVIR